VNVKWFAPLLLLGFAGFVLAAKAYLRSIPREVIPPPALGSSSRIYGETPVAKYREAKQSNIFRPRPRSLDPLPIMAMARPVPEPVRPTLSTASARTDGVAPTVGSAAKNAAPASPQPGVAMAPTAADNTGKPGASDSKPADDGLLTVAAADATARPKEATTAPASTVVAMATGGVLDGKPAFADAATKPYEPPITAVSDESDTSDESNDPEVTEPTPAPARDPDAPSTWAMGIQSLAEQIDDAAVRLRSNYENAPQVVLSRAFDALQAGQFDSALHDFDTVLARDPELNQAWEGRGEALVGLNRFEEAVEAYAKVVEHANAAHTTRYNFGVVLYRLSRYSEAAEQFRLVVKQDPEHAEAHYNLATLAQRDGRLAEALGSWRTFTRLRPAVAGGWFNLGIVQMDYDHPAEAVPCFQKVIELDKNDADAHINLAMAFLASDQPNEALKALETAETRLPGDRVILRYLADVHAQLAEAGGAGAVMHRQQAEAYQARISPPQARERRAAVAGSLTEITP